MNENLAETRSPEEFLRSFSTKLRERLGEKTNPTILIQGGFGKNNTGDDTLLLVAREKVLEMYPEARIVALCYDPVNLFNLYGIEGVYYGSRKAVGHLFSADGIVIAGGGLINDVYSTSYIYNIFDPRGKFAMITTLILHMRRKFTSIFLVGVHAIPNFVVRFLMKLVLPRVDVLGVRDLDSVEKITSVGVKNYFLAHDAALLYHEKPTIPFAQLQERYGIPNDKLIGFNFRYVKEKEVSDSVEKQMISVLDQIREKYPEYSIVMIPFSDSKTVYIENDITAMRIVRDQLQDKTNVFLIDEYMRPADAKEIMSVCNALILTRHHALVLSYEYQIPTIAISYNIKCQQFCELAGYDYVFDYYNMTTDDIMNSVDQVLSRKAG